MAGNIEFNEESQPQPVYQTEQKSFLTRLVFATGLASTDKGAQYVLLGIAVLATILAFVAPVFIK
ncbi:MAG: hypothetical protein WCS97_01060 [Candidatus Paceibacterota bacterium]|jgi:hypothetical protein